MLTAPLKWLVQLVAWLPDALRPGVFLALIVLAVWFAFVQRGLPNLWHACCRGAARVVDLLVGVALLPDYLLTTSRHKRGEAPAEAVLVIGEFADRALDGAGSLYERHRREPIVWKQVPWIPCVVIVVVLAIPWFVMDRAPASGEVRQNLASVYGHWRDFEDWADVDPSRRIETGVSWPPRPVVRSMRRHSGTVGITVRCLSAERCHGRLILRTAGGKRIHSRLVAAAPQATKTVHMKLTRHGTQANHLEVRVARTNPG
jgi:hypothetical protein